MNQFRHAIQSIISQAEEVVDHFLEGDYSVTIIIHTDSGEVKDAVVASTGEKATAIPALTAAANSPSEEMGEMGS